MTDIRTVLEEAVSEADPRLEEILKEIDFQEEGDFVQMAFNQSDSESALMNLDRVLAKLCNDKPAMPEQPRSEA